MDPRGEWRGVRAPGRGSGYPHGALPISAGLPATWSQRSGRAEGRRGGRGGRLGAVGAGRVWELHLLMCAGVGVVLGRDDAGAQESAAECGQST